MTAMQCLQKPWKFAIFGSSSVKAPLTNSYLILTSFLLRLSITLQSQLGLPGKKWKTKGITDKLKVASSFSGCFSDFKTGSLTMNKNSTLSCGMLGMAKIDFLSLFFLWITTCLSTTTIESERWRISTRISLVTHMLNSRTVRRKTFS